MAEPEADPHSSDSVDLKPIFSIPDSDDVGRSPTSPLDFGGLFSPRSSSPRFPHPHKVGLSVLTDSSIDESLSLSDSPNIVLAPQIKKVVVNSTPKLSTQPFVPCLDSTSLPKNYAAVNLHHPHPSPRISSSFPVDIIISTQAYSRSLSGREMALSEDYTCIISHGPNPKTTHIFGDCILDCDPKELLGSLDTKDEIEKPLPTVDSFCQLCLCTHDFPNSHSHREVSAEKESENDGVKEDSLDISPISSYKEDLFHMAMHAS